MRQRGAFAAGLLLLAALLSETVSGQENWVYRFNGPASYYDGANSIVVGGDGNLYAAGYSFKTGALQDFTVISLTPSGAERWVYCDSAPGEAYSVVVGDDGNIYAAGYTSESATWNNIAVVSLTPSGAKQWTYRYDGSASLHDAAYTIAVGADGNLYVAGYSFETGTFEDFTVISLTPSGAERWLYRYSGSGNEADGALAIAMGADGNVYAAGLSWESGAWGDFTIISLTPSGVERWVYRYNGPGGYSHDGAYAITAGQNGNLYATGHSWGNGVSTEFTVISLAPSGVEEWVYRYNPEGGRGEGLSVVEGPDGDLYAAGYSYKSATGIDFTVIGLDRSGGERWVYRYEVPGTEFDRDKAYSIVIGADGNIYAAGTSEQDEIGVWDDFIVISLTPSGVERWVYRYNGPGNWIDRAFSIAAGEDGNVYGAGYSWGSGTSTDFTVVSLASDQAIPSVVTGGGWMPGDSLAPERKRNFGFNVHSQGDDVRGQLQYDDHGTKMKVHSEEMLTLTIHNETEAEFAGSCRVDHGSGYTFECAVEDNGEPGHGVDKFSMEIWDADGIPYYSAGDFLGGGNIQIHTSNDEIVRHELVRNEETSPNPRKIDRLDQAHQTLSEDQAVLGNHPNPFSSSTTISYNLTHSSRVTVSIYDLTGTLVRMLVNGHQDAGRCSIEWDGKDQRGKTVATGTYIYRLTAGDFSQTGKMIMVN